MMKSEELDSFRPVLEAAGLAVPEELMAGVLRGCLELRSLSLLVRQPRHPEAEPANVFSLYLSSER